MKEKVDRDTVGMLMGLDNGNYYSTRRMRRGAYHVEGKLVVAAPT